MDAVHRDATVPDWPSGLSTVVGAVSTTLTRLNGDGTLRILTSRLQSRVKPGTSPPRRRWPRRPSRPGSFPDPLLTADEVSIGMGSNVADWVLDHYFRPTD